MYCRHFLNVSYKLRCKAIRWKYSFAFEIIVSSIGDMGGTGVNEGNGLVAKSKQRSIVVPPEVPWEGVHSSQSVADWKWMIRFASWPPGGKSDQWGKWIWDLDTFQCECRAACLWVSRCRDHQQNRLWKIVFQESSGRKGRSKLSSDALS